jgi:hypothetical protein
LRVGEKVKSRSGGATGQATSGPWDYEIIAVEHARTSKPPRGHAHLAVMARLTSHGQIAGTTGDGRDVVIEDSLGRRYPPMFKLLGSERAARGMPDVYDQVVPNVSFDTTWVYEVPTDATRLRLLLPFDNVELPLSPAAQGPNQP